MVLEYSPGAPTSVIAGLGGSPELRAHLHERTSHRGASGGQYPRRRVPATSLPSSRRYRRRRRVRGRSSHGCTIGVAACRLVSAISDEPLVVHATRTCISSRRCKPAASADERGHSRLHVLAQYAALPADSLEAAVHAGVAGCSVRGHSPK